MGNGSSGILEISGGSMGEFKTFDAALVGKRIKIARGRVGWTQADLAMRAALTPAAISGFEQGKRIPRMSSLLKISSALSVSADFLLGTKRERPDITASYSKTQAAKVAESFEDALNYCIRHSPTAVEIAHNVKEEVFKFLEERLCEMAEEIKRKVENEKEISKKS